MMLFHPQNVMQGLPSTNWWVIIVICVLQNTQTQKTYCRHDYDNMYYICVCMYYITSVYACILWYVHIFIYLYTLCFSFRCPCFNELIWIIAYLSHFRNFIDSGSRKTERPSISTSSKRGKTSTVTLSCTMASATHFSTWQKTVLTGETAATPHAATSLAGWAASPRLLGWRIKQGMAIPTV